jgi:hypothetical protein
MVGDLVAAFEHRLDGLRVLLDAPRLIESSGCSRCKMLSASMSKVSATAQRAPFGQGTGLLIIASAPYRRGPQAP